LDQDRRNGEIETVVDRVSKDMPLYDQIPEPDLVSFIHMAKQKLGGSASHEAVLKRAYDMAVNADPDLRAKAAALQGAATDDAERVAAAKRANATNLRSTSSGKARELTQEEELGAIYDKHKG
jgi:phosphoserine phosphatase